jgi:hypothetical protein
VTLIHLSVRSFDVLVLRWLRSWGYHGDRSRVAGMLIALVALAASGGAAVWLHGWFAGFGQQPAVVRTGFAALLAFVFFFCSGPVLVLTEAIRGYGSRLQSALSSLPLTAREIGILIWLPTFGVSLVFLVLLFLPGVAAFSGLRFPLALSASYTVLPLLSGYGLAAIIVTVVRTGLGRSTWAPVQYPVIGLAWFALSGVEVWQTAVSVGAGALSPWGYVLLVPWMARDVGSGVLPGSLLAVVGAVTIVSLALLVWSAVMVPAARYPTVLWRWSPSWRPALATVELTRLLRSRRLVANIVAAEVVVLGLVFALYKLPTSARPAIASLLLAVIMAFVAVPVVSVRGLTTSGRPAPLVLGFGPVQWALTQMALAAALAVAAALPAAVGFAALGVPAGTVVGLGGAYAASSIGLAIGIGWAVPAGPDNPLAQTISIFGLVLVLAPIGLTFDHLFGTGSPLWIAANLIVGSFGVALGAALERERWCRTIQCGGAHG